LEEAAEKEPRHYTLPKTSSGTTKSPKKKKKALRRGSSKSTRTVFSSDNGNVQPRFCASNVPKTVLGYVFSFFPFLHATDAKN